MMTDNQFRDLVRRMRQAQKEYFKTRNSGWLQCSKQLEREVDQELKSAHTGQETGNLFEND